MNTKPRILITGASGQLGQEFMAYFKNSDFNVAGLSREDADFTNAHGFTNLEAHLVKFRPEILINCAAYTAVDKAEVELELAHAINVKLPLKISQLAEKLDFNILHFSTDYVFDGNAKVPYKESDLTEPLSIYGKTKRDGELALLNSQRSLILRVSWLYSEFGSNFPKTIDKLLAEKAELSIVNDQTSSPTWTKPLVKFVVDQLLCNAKLFNGTLYHYAEDGEGSWYDMAQIINEFHRKKLNPVTSDQFPQVAKRPTYSKLDNSLAKKELNLEPDLWQNNLKTFLKIIQ